jgi:hypothetical protein
LVTHTSHRRWRYRQILLIIFFVLLLLCFVKQLLVGLVIGKIVVTIEFVLIGVHFRSQCCLFSMMTRIKVNISKNIPRQGILVTQNLVDLPRLKGGHTRHGMEIVLLTKFTTHGIFHVGHIDNRLLRRFPYFLFWWTFDCRLGRVVSLGLGHLLRRSPGWR